MKGSGSFKVLCYESILLWTLLTDKGGKQGKFDLPQTYDRSYRIPFSIVPPDLAYKLRKEQDRRSERREEKSLTMDHLYEFRTVLRHFINFKQKQKVILNYMYMLRVYQST